jgi:uncharacterized cupredoxin-like copper-binding protein
MLAAHLLKLRKMAKSFSAFQACASILIAMLFVLVIESSSKQANYNNVFAATNTGSTSSVSSSIPKVKQDTFSAIGTISSLVITVPATKSADGFNITDAFKVILTGEWTLSVHKGNVTNFAANFLASPMDGTKPHIHQITNFQKTIDKRQQMVQLTPDNSLSINGTVDVKINGINIWHNAHVSILISKGNTIAIRLNDKDTENHFGQQPVLGIVNRLIL